MIVAWSDRGLVMPHFLQGLRGVDWCDSSIDEAAVCAMERSKDANKIEVLSWLRQRDSDKFPDPALSWYAAARVSCLGSLERPEGDERQRASSPLPGHRPGGGVSSIN